MGACGHSGGRRGRVRPARFRGIASECSSARRSGRRGRRSADVRGPRVDKWRASDDKFEARQNIAECYRTLIACARGDRSTAARSRAGDGATFTLPERNTLSAHSLGGDIARPCDDTGAAQSSRTWSGYLWPRASLAALSAVKDPAHSSAFTAKPWNTLTSAVGHLPASGEASSCAAGADIVQAFLCHKLFFLRRNVPHLHNTIEGESCALRRPLYKKA